MSLCDSVIILGDVHVALQASHILEIFNPTTMGNIPQDVITAGNSALDRGASRIAP